MSDERLDPEDAPEASLQEHLARYRFAQGAVSGRVLDVACGTAYGAALLGATGADVSHECLRSARRRWPRLVAADGLRLPFGEVFDGVVSFETVEHVRDPEGFVAECRRVLRPGGRLVMSTPNRELWSPRSPRPLQRHHVREFNRREFEALLRPFRKVEIFGQVLLTRRGAAGFEAKVLAKRVLRALVPFRRLRRASAVPPETLTPDPAYEVRPAGGRTAAVFVAVAER